MMLYAHKNLKRLYFNDPEPTDKAIKHELLSELKITGRRRSIQTFSPASKCSLLSS